jgi:hypothetical protein
MDRLPDHADTAYDADRLRQAMAAKGALAVIPNNTSRALKYPLDKHLYAQRQIGRELPWPYGLKSGCRYNQLYKPALRLSAGMLCRQ